MLENKMQGPSCATSDDSLTGTKAYDGERDDTPLPPGCDWMTGTLAQGADTEGWMDRYRMQSHTRASQILVWGRPGGGRYEMMTR